MLTEGPAIFPGSFDPLTNGHVDVISRSLKIFDSLIVAVLSNTEKSMLFSVEERVAMIGREFASFGKQVQVKSFSGLLVDFARREKSKVIIRGLRAVSDYDYEAQMALMNKSLSDEVETLFLVTREKNSYISSTLVRQIASLGGDVSHLVPPGVLECLKKKIRG